MLARDVHILMVEDQHPCKWLEAFKTTTPFLRPALHYSWLRQQFNLSSLDRKAFIGMASQAVPNLDHLPTEVLERIFFFIEDLRSIYHLITASPTASRVFESSEWGPKILDRVLSLSMSPDVVGLIRLVGLVRTATPRHPPAPSLEDFVALYTCCGGEMGWRLIPVTLSLANTLRGQAPHLVRGVLLTARRICCLTWACLEYYREICSSVTPSHLDVPFAWGTWAEKPWRQEVPPGKPYKPQPLGPSCWVEEQRVMRGFWRLQLLVDLRLAASDGRLDWNLGEGQSKLSPEDLYAPWTWQEEEFLTVVDFLDHFQDGAHILAQHCCHSLPGPPPHYASASRWQDPPVPGVLEPMFSREETSKLRPSCWGFYNVTLRGVQRSPIRGCPFWPYRKLGMAIWDKEKLEALEMPVTRSRSPERPWVSTAYQVFTWRSLLSQDLIDKLTTQMEEDFQKKGVSLNRSNPDM